MSENTKIKMPLAPSKAKCMALQKELFEMRDFTGKVVVLASDALSEKYRSREWMIVIASGGSGCVQGAGGAGVFVQFAPDRETAKFRLGNVDRLATEDEAAWFHETWEKAPPSRWW